jgi:RHS repeat-associated protein
MDVVQRYEYTGRELASESGEYYFRYRVYGPALGQFYTRDPIGYGDGMALYAGRFAINLAKDPTGETDTWQLQFVYKQNGQLKVIRDATTKETDIDIDFDMPKGEGISDVEFHSALWAESGQSTAGETATQTHCCLIRMQLRVRLPAIYKGMNISYAKPQVPTTASYMAHMTSVLHDAAILVEPELPALRAYIMREHERGHAKAWISIIQTPLRQLLQNQLTKQQGKIMQLCPEPVKNNQAIAEIATRAFGVANAYLSDKDSTVMMSSADAPTRAIFANSKDWEKSPTLDDPYGPIERWKTTSP